MPTENEEDKEQYIRLRHGLKENEPYFEGVDEEAVTKAYQYLLRGDTKRIKTNDPTLRGAFKQGYREGKDILLSPIAHKHSYDEAPLLWIARFLPENSNLKKLLKRYSIQLMLDAYNGLPHTEKLTKTGQEALREVLFLEKSWENYQFYGRRILAALFPTYFVSLNSISPTVMRAPYMKGEKIKFANLDQQHITGFKQALKSAGLLDTAIDTLASNFVIPDKNPSAAQYFDDIGYSFHVYLLYVWRQYQRLKKECNGNFQILKTWQKEELSELIKHMFERVAVIRAMPQHQPYVPKNQSVIQTNYFDFEKLSTLIENETAHPDQKRLKKWLTRLQVHAQTFEPVNLDELYAFIAPDNTLKPIIINYKPHESQTPTIERPQNNYLELLDQLSFQQQVVDWFDESKVRTITEHIPEMLATSQIEAANILPMIEDGNPGFLSTPPEWMVDSLRSAIGYIHSLESLPLLETVAHIFADVPDKNSTMFAEPSKKLLQAKKAGNNEECLRMINVILAGYRQSFWDYLDYSPEMKQRAYAAMATVIYFAQKVQFFSNG